MHATAEPTPIITAAPEQIVYLDRSKIRVVSNVRTSFDPNYLAELGASIRALGVQTPLWIRPAGDDGTHDLIAGECRLRASGIAELQQLPCIIKSVDEKGALELQILENLHRRDVAPLEEGLGYQRLLAELGYTIESLVEKLNKSRSYIYGRIKLAELPRLGREALTAGHLTPSVALRVARITDPKAQKECLGKIIAHESYQTDSAAAELIAREYMCELKGAPFDREDPTLEPKRGKCSTCPLRSGNQKDLFPDQVKGRADICTDPACFKRKAEASWKKRSAAHREAGGKVVEGNDAWRAHYLDLKSRCWEIKKERTYRDLLKEAGAEVPIVLARDQYGEIRELAPRKEVTAALTKSGILKKSKDSSGDSWKVQQRAEVDKRRKERAVRIAQLQTLDRATQSRGPVDLDAFLLQWLQIITVKLAAGADADVCKILVKARDIDPSKHKKQYDDGVRSSIAAAGREVSTWPDTMSLIMQLLTAVHYGYNGNKDPLPEFCALYGVDAAAIEKETRASLDKRKKKPAAKQKPEPKPAVRKLLTPEKRAKIAKAQRERWARSKKGTDTTEQDKRHARMAAALKARWAARKNGTPSATVESE